MSIRQSWVGLTGRSPVRTKAVWCDLAKMDGPQGRGDGQHGWHEWIGNLFSGRSILDAGAGLGYSRQRLEGRTLAHSPSSPTKRRNSVVLQDLSPGARIDIHDDVGTLADRIVDVVTAFDVIEHVLDDCLFLWNLCRIARESVVLTTPNYDVSKAVNPFHIREYSPLEFLHLLEGLAVSELVAGNSNGTERVALTRDVFARHGFPHQAVILDVSVT